MKKLLILLIIIITPGCSLLEDNSAKFSNTVDMLLRQEPGWNASGYIIENKNHETKLGLIEDEILYNMSLGSKDWKKEEDVKNKGLIFGFFLNKDF